MTSRLGVIFNVMIPYFKNRHIDDITTGMIEGYQSYRMNSKKKNGGGPIRPATVNREIACIKHMYTKAIEWDLTDKNPAKPVKLLPEENERVRWLRQEEAERLVDNCSKHLRPIVITALNTGMRYGEIIRLRWNEVDFDNRIITILRTKNKEIRKVPINDYLLETLVELKKNLNCDMVFTYKGKPVKTVRRSFHSAKQAAGIEDFRFHDLRHTFASHLVMKGVDLMTVKELLGHKTMTMTLRYSHLSDEHKMNAVTKLDGIFNGGD